MSRALNLLRTRAGFRRLWLGNVVSQLGDWVGWVAVSVLALHAGGGALDLALVFAAHHLPAALLAPVAGPVVDRVDRRKLLVGTVVVQGLLTVAMVGAAAVASIGALQILLMLRSATTAFFAPAERAALPRVVEREELLLAGVFDAGTWSVVFTFGMALGGLLSALGPVLALAIDAVTFGVAAIILAGLPAMPPHRPEHDDARRSGPHLRAFARELGEMFRHVWARPSLARAVLAKTPMALAGGAGWLVVNLVADDLGGVAQAALVLGILHAARGVGTGIGPALVAVAVGRGRARIRLWRTLFAAGFAAIVIFAAVADLWLLVAISVVWGMGSGANWVLTSEEIQRCAPDRLQGRTGALDQFGMIFGQTVGVFAAALATTLGATHVFAVGGPVLIAALLWAGLDARASLPRRSDPAGLGTHPAYAGVGATRPSSPT